MTPTQLSPDIVERLNAHCVGHPHAKIEWPHRLLHDARDEIVRLRAQAARTQEPVAWIASPAGSCTNDKRTAEIWRDHYEQEIQPLYADPAQPAWQPIKTAPKDKPIMLCVTGFLPCTGRWWPIDSCWTSFDWEGHFESDAECTAYVNGCSYEPTHWMPMPAGPSLPSTDREAP